MTVIYDARLHCVVCIPRSRFSISVRFLVPVIGSTGLVELSPVPKLNGYD